MPTEWMTNGGMAIEYETEEPNQFLNLRVYDFEATFGLYELREEDRDELPMYEIICGSIPTTNCKGEPFDFRNALSNIRTDSDLLRIAAALDDEFFV